MAEIPDTCHLYFLGLELTVFQARNAAWMLSEPGSGVVPRAL